MVLDIKNFLFIELINFSHIYTTQIRLYIIQYIFLHIDIGSYFQ